MLRTIPPEGAIRLMTSTADNLHVKKTTARPWRQQAFARPCLMKPRHSVRLLISPSPHHRLLRHNIIRNLAGLLRVVLEGMWCRVGSPTQKLATAPFANDLSRGCFEDITVENADGLFATNARLIELPFHDNLSSILLD